MCGPQSQSDKCKDFGKGKNLSDIAERALAEADARRRALKNETKFPREIAGRGGLEPIRYGDWEINGLASDF